MAAGAALLRLARSLAEPFDEALAEKERDEMDRFLLQHAQRYDFSHGEHGELFRNVFRTLVQERFLTQPDCVRIQPRDHQLRVLQCMRVLMRDPAHHDFFVEAGGMTELVKLFSELEQEHFAHEHVEFGSGMLVECLSIIKRFNSLPALAAAAGETKLQRALVALLSTREALVLQCVLVAMHQLVQHEEQLHALGQLGGAETLLCILKDYQLSFKVQNPLIIACPFPCISSQPSSASKFVYGGREGKKFLRHSPCLFLASFDLILPL